MGDRLHPGEYLGPAGGQRAVPARPTCRVLGAPVDAGTADDVISRIAGWAAGRESRVVCFCNAHVAVTASTDASFRCALESADLVAPDGAPVAWLMRRMGVRTQRRVSGPDVMWAYCERAAATGEALFLYGSTEATLDALRRRLQRAWPTLRIAGAHAPPFRPLTDAEERDVVHRINASGAGTVWVSLGCPKQEFWMAAMRGRIDAVMLGVGAAFDFHAGTLQRAPRWMQRTGLEWLYRLSREPRRLWRRYLFTNTAFVVGALRQWLGGRR